MSDSSTGFDPRAPDFVHNPYAIYRVLRDRPAAAWNVVSRSWMITRYDDVRTVLSDHETFPLRDGSSGRALRDLEVLGADPPAHGRLRRAIAPGFTPLQVSALRPLIERVVDDLLDRGLRDRRLELMGALAVPLPILVTTQMLGLDGIELERVKGWADDEMTIITPDTPASIQTRVDRTTSELLTYFEGRVRDARRRPREMNVFGQLLGAADAGQLSDAEVVASLILFVRGGSHTVTHLIGNSILALLRNRDQLDALYERPALWDTAVEELTRHAGPMHAVTRVVRRPVTIHGVTLQPGDAVEVVLGSANRDERRYPDGDELRLDRPASNQLGFGRGIHYCVGAELGKLQVRIAIERLLARMPVMSRANLWLEPDWANVWAIRGLRSLFLRCAA